MSWKVAVLGGSSPFTVSLIDALHDQQPTLPPFTLALHGRNPGNLAAIAAYAASQLTGIARPPMWDTDVSAVLDGADVVIHQIRYGGLELRGVGEAICERFGLVADETLGAAALMTGLAIRRQVAETAKRIARLCPDAWVLNLTNPLSAVTSWMSEAHPRVIGICELPRYTLECAAAELGICASDMRFDYVGFNHRGFFTRLRAGEADLLAALATKDTGVSIGGITGSVIGEVEALPLKYFALRDMAWSAEQRRAPVLQRLSAQIFEELRDRPIVSPPSLQQRNLSWYPLSVVPMLAALASPVPSVHACNISRQDGLVVEQFVEVSSAGITVPANSTAAPSAIVADWLERYTRHEIAFLAAIENPSRTTITAALAADPTVPSPLVEPLADVVLAECRGFAAAATMS